MILLDLLVILLSFILAYIPVFLYITLVWFIDRYDREPIFLVLVAFIWGAFGSAIFSMIFEVLLSLPLLFFHESVSYVVTSVLIAPPVEECAKALILLILFFYYKFDNLTDGIVYGAIVGFGFSATENLVYFISTYFEEGLGIWILTVIFRLMIASLAHGFLTAITGAGLGIAKTTRDEKMKFLLPPITLFVAISLHSLSNLTVVLTKFFSVVFILFDLFIVAAGTLTILAVLFVALERESQLLRRELLTELREGFISESEYNIVHHYFLRRKATRIISKKYGREKSKQLSKLLELETRLAFEKDRLSREVVSQRVEERVDGIRADISEAREKLHEIIDELGDDISQ